MPFVLTVTWIRIACCGIAWLADGVWHHRVWECVLNCDSRGDGLPRDFVHAGGGLPQEGVCDTAWGFLFWFMRFFGQEAVQPQHERRGARKSDA